MQFIPYSLALVLAALVQGGLALYAWQRRAAGARPFALLMLAVCLWGSFYALELAGADLPTKILWAKAEYLGIVAVPLASLSFALAYTGREAWLTRQRLAWLSIVPLLTLALVITNEAHGLIWSQTRLAAVGPFLFLDVVHGAWFWVHAVYSYSLLLSGAHLIVGALVRQPVAHRGQVAGLLVALAAPWLGNAITLFSRPPIPLDLTPFAFTITGLALSWSLFRYRLLDLMPVAREAVIEGMRDGMLVVDALGSVADINPTAQQMLGLVRTQARGRPAASVLAAWPPLAALLASQSEGQIEIRVVGETPSFVDVKLSPLRDRLGRLTGQLLICRDVTSRKQAELSLRRQNRYLTALHQITLDLLNRKGVDDLLKAILDRATELLEAPDGGLAVLQPDGTLAVCAAVGGLEPWLGHRLPSNAGLIGLVFASGQPQAIEDYQHWPDRLEVYDALEMRSLIVAPIVAGSKTIGVLTLARRDPHRLFDQDERQILDLFAQMASLVLDSNQLYHELQLEIIERQQAEENLRRQKEQLENLVTLARAATEQPSLSETLNNVLATTISLTGAERGSFFQLDDQEHVTHSLRIEAGQVVIEPHVDPRVMERGLAGWVYEQRSAALAADTQLDDRWLELPDSPYAFRSAVAAPIQSGLLRLGIFLLYHSRPGFFTAAHKDFMQAAAGQISLAIRNAQLYDSQRRTATERGMVYEVLKALSRERDPQQVAQTAVDVIAHFAGWPRVAVRLSDAARQQWVVLAASQPQLQPSASPDGQDAASRVLATGRPQFVLAATGDTSQTVPASGSIREISVPLRQGTAVIGALSVEGEEARAFSPNTAALVEALGEAISLALDSANLYQHLQAELAERKRAEATVAALNAGLRQSNADLEQFAYAASHDLQEPLRVVTIYTQLLAQRYAGRLDADADQIIFFAVDGAKRMQALIRGLLTYSRVGRPGAVFRSVDCNAVLGEALANLRLAVEDSQAVITHDRLPVVHGDPVLLMELFQNLVGNALKFQPSPATPRVHISARPGPGQPGAWVFAVQDNGIGIAPEHLTQIFGIFQRLHSREKYPGAGIGLATCQRIVERHGGRIWAESPATGGATFYFTLQRDEA